MGVPWCGAICKKCGYAMLTDAKDWECEECPVSAEAVKKAVEAAAKSLWFADNSDYRTGLWEVLDALLGEEIDIDRLHDLCGFEDEDGDCG